MEWWAAQQLKSKRAGTRQKAVERLAASGTTQAVQRLRTAFNDPSPEVRVAAVQAFGRFRQRDALEILIDCLSHREADVRETAAAAIRQFQDATTIGPLVRLLEDPQAKVRYQAARSLEALGW